MLVGEAEGVRLLLPAAPKREGFLVGNAFFITAINFS